MLHGKEKTAEGTFTTETDLTNEDRLTRFALWELDEYASMSVGELSLLGNRFRAYAPNEVNALANQLHYSLPSRLGSCILFYPAKLLIVGVFYDSKGRCLHFRGLTQNHINPTDRPKELTDKERLGCVESWKALQRERAQKHMTSHHTGHTA